jgi:ribosomal protein L27
MKIVINKIIHFICCRHAVIPGNIIIRQRGQKFHAGENVGMGRDHTIYSLKTGWVHFKFDVKKQRNVVSVSETLNPNIRRKKMTAVEASPSVNLTSTTPVEALEAQQKI